MKQTKQRNRDTSKSGIAGSQHSRATLMAVAVTATVGGLLSVPAEFMGIGAGGMALGATYQWDGEGNNNWSTANNWSPNVAPSAGAQNNILEFGARFAPAIRRSPNNNIADSFNVNQVIFTNSSGAAFTLTGNSVEMVGTNAAITQNSIYLQSISNDLTLTENTTLNGNGSGAVTLSGGLNGGGTLTKSGTSTFILSGANSYTGATAIKNGTLALGGGDNRLPTGTTVTLGDGTTNDSGVLKLDSHIQTVAGLLTAGTGTGNRVVNGNATAATLTVNVGTGTNTFGGILGGTGTNDNNFNLTKTGAGTFILSGTNTHSGTTTITDGTLQVDGSGAIASAVDIRNTGTLAGSGHLSGLASVNNGGTISPGSSHSAGTLTTVGQIWQAGGKYEVDITTVTSDGSQAGAGTNYDTLAGTTLNLGGLDSGNKFTLLVDGRSLSSGSFVYGKTYQWDIASFTQGITFAQNYGVSNINSLFAMSLSYIPTFANGQWSVSATGGVGTSSHLYLNYNAVPEAGTAVFGAIALMPILGHRQRRKAQKTAPAA